jgi:hypothetical protein
MSVKAEKLSADHTMEGTRMMKFAATRDEHDAIAKIVRRAREMGIAYELLDMNMDLEAVHSNGCPLDFTKWLAFPDFDFSHDVVGIYNHIDRTTGQLGDCFLPRCAKTA